MTSVVRQATLISFDSATWTAMVQVDGSDSNVVMDVGQWLAPGSLAEDDQVAVLLYDHTNPAWGVVVGPHGGAPRLDWPGLLSLHQGLPALRGCWPMSSVSASGASYDFGGQGFNLTYNGNPVYGLHDNLVPYLAFDGTGDYLSHADSASLDILGTEAYIAAKGLTAGCWAWFGADGTSQSLMGKILTAGDQRSWSLQRNASNQIQALVNSTGAAAGNHITSGSVASGSAWHFCVMRFTPSAEVAVWVDGVKTTNVTSVPAALFNSTAQLAFGALSAGSGQLMTGRLALAWLCVSALPDALIDRLWRVGRLAFGV